MITFIIAFNKNTSVPGFNLNQISASSAKPVFLGSTTISLVPFLTACFILLPIIGWASVALEPMTNNNSAPRISSIEFVMAPLPNVAARPATVGACQVLAQ